VVGAGRGSAVGEGREGEEWGGRRGGGERRGGGRGQRSVAGASVENQSCGVNFFEERVIYRK